MSFFELWMACYVAGIRALLPSENPVREPEAWEVEELMEDLAKIERGGWPA